MQFTIHLWEVLLLIAVAAFTVAMVYLIRALKRLNASLDKINAVLDESAEPIAKTLQHTEEVLESAADLTDRINRASEGVENFIGGRQGDDGDGSDGFAATDLLKYGTYAYEIVMLVSDFLKKRRANKVYRTEKELLKQLKKFDK